METSKIPIAALFVEFSSFFRIPAKMPDPLKHALNMLTVARFDLISIKITLQLLSVYSCFSLIDTIG